MVAVRMDARLNARIDPSDVIQDTFAIAHRRIDRFLEEQPIGFYPWLRQIAIEKLIDLHRQHTGARCRSIQREASLQLPNDSAIMLAGIATGEPSPSQHLVRKELVQRVSCALRRLPSTAQEALLLRFVEQLSTKEAADISGISVSAFRGRQFRALAQLRSLLDEPRRADQS